MRIRGQSAFSLLEISIVLLVIGFIAGGVLVSRDIIHNAEIRATIRQVEMFDSAFIAFRLKYDCLAGDCIDASTKGFQPVLVRVWSYAFNDTLTPSILDRFNPVSTAYADWQQQQQQWEGGYTEFNFEPNGDGDGIIDPGWGQELFVGVNQLTTTGLLKGLTEESTVALALMEAYSPTNHDKHAFWGIAFLEDNHYYVPITNAAENKEQDIATLTPAVAQRIDIKIDNGLPQSGGRVDATSRNAMEDLAQKLPFDPLIDAGPKGADTPFCVTYEVIPNQPGGVIYQYNAENNTHAPGSVCAISIRAAI